MGLKALRWSICLDRFGDLVQGESVYCCRDDGQEGGEALRRDAELHDDVCERSLVGGLSIDESIEGRSRVFISNVLWRLMGII